MSSIFARKVVKSEMAKAKSDTKRTRGRPASTPEQRENELISLAIDLAEQQLRDGTATPSVIVHYLKLGSSRGQLENQMLEKKTELVSAQADSVKSTARTEEMYEKAIEAMRIYSGHGRDNGEELSRDVEDSRFR